MLWKECIYKWTWCILDNVIRIRLLDRVTWNQWGENLAPLLFWGWTRNVCSVACFMTKFLRFMSAHKHSNMLSFSICLEKWGFPVSECLLEYIGLGWALTKLRKQYSEKYFDAPHKKLVLCWTHLKVIESWVHIGFWGSFRPNVGCAAVNLQWCLS